MPHEELGLWEEGENWKPIKMTETTPTPFTGKIKLKSYCTEIP